MKSRKVFTTVAFLVLFLHLPVFGGEWHSAGNAPLPPYFPTVPANYLCSLTITTGAGGKYYRIKKEHAFRAQEFQQPGHGRSSFLIEGEADPGMNGQRIGLAFSKNTAGGEDVHLALHPQLEGNGQILSGVSYVSERRNRRSIEGRSMLYVSQKNGSSRSVLLEVVCQQLK